ncbi:MAG: hypothetical protein AAGJ38_08090, partial [Planctomycetota bacterium]
WMFNNEMIQQALRSLEWLHDVQYTGKDEQFAPVGSLGWYPRGGDKARFNQTPAEASGTIDANLEAYRVTNDRQWLDHAYKCLNWFLGDNDLRQPLYDNTTGGCCNALLSQGVDENQGAQATVSWLLSLLSLYEHNLDLEGEANQNSSPQPSGPVESVGPENAASGQDVTTPPTPPAPPTPTISKNLAPPPPSNPSATSA